MEIDDDGGRREFELRGQRRGTESDKGTAQLRFPDITLPVEKDQCPNRPSDQGQFASASTAFDPLVEFL